MIARARMTKDDEMGLLIAARETVKYCVDNRITIATNDDRSTLAPTEYEQYEAPYVPTRGGGKII